MPHILRLRSTLDFTLDLVRFLVGLVGQVFGFVLGLFGTDAGGLFGFIPNHLYLFGKKTDQSACGSNYKIRRKDGKFYRVRADPIRREMRDIWLSSTLTTGLNALDQSLRDSLVDCLGGVLGGFDGSLLETYRGAEETDIAGERLTEHFELIKVFWLGVVSLL